MAFSFFPFSFLIRIRIFSVLASVAARHRTVRLLSPTRGGGGDRVPVTSATPGPFSLLLPD